MNVRPATIQDVSQIALLTAELREAEVNEETVGAALERIVANPSSVTLVVDDNGTLFGMVTLNLVYKLPKVEARVDEVVVAKSARGRGIGTILMDAADNWAWEHIADSIEFTSRPSRTAANALYQKHGYELRETNVYKKSRP